MLQVVCLSDSNYMVVQIRTKFVIVQHFTVWFVYTYVFPLQKCELLERVMIEQILWILMYFIVKFLPYLKSASCNNLSIFVSFGVKVIIIVNLTLWPLWNKYACTCLPSLWDSRCIGRYKFGGNISLIGLIYYSLLSSFILFTYF